MKHVKHCDTSWTTVKHHETLLKHCETSWNTRHSMQQYRRSMRRRQALNVETSAFGAPTSAIVRKSFDVTISALDAETSVLGAAAAALVIAWSYRRYWRGISGDIGDCGVGITLRMCNIVTNHIDMSTFSKPGIGQLSVFNSSLNPYWILYSDLTDESLC